MYTTRTYTMSLAAAVAALVAPALLFLGDGTAQAVDPLPEPPSIGDHRLNPPPASGLDSAGPTPRLHWAARYQSGHITFAPGCPAADEFVIGDSHPSGCDVMPGPLPGTALGGGAQVDPPVHRGRGAVVLEERLSQRLG